MSVLGKGSREISQKLVTYTDDQWLTSLEIGPNESCRKKKQITRHSSLSAYSILPGCTHRENCFV